MTDLPSIAAREAAATPGRLAEIRKNAATSMPELVACQLTDCASGGAACACSECARWRLMDERAWLLGEVDRLLNIDAAHRALAAAQAGHIDTVNAAYEKALGELSRLTAALATARAEGFEAGKEAAAKDCAPTLTRLKVLVRALDKDEGGAWTAEAHAIYCELSRALPASASPAGNLKRGDQ